MRIAILFHEKDRHRDLRRYDIMHVAKYWETLGHETVPVFGTESFVPAEIAILHVDLSVVPQRFLELADRYPVCLNKNITDIRKSVISRHLLSINDDYQGAVIVKSNYNSAGVPERVNGTWLSRAMLHGRQLLWKWQRQVVISKQKDYLIFGHLSLVPREVFNRPDLIVEKFLPERDRGLYSVRSCVFLCEATPCQMTISSEPIVSVGNSISLVECETHPEILQLRKQLGFDYGKFDYVIHEGKVVLLDANKTTGSGDLAANPLIERFRKKRAEALLDYYQQTLAEKS